jgi:hypothetical protein
MLVVLDFLESNLRRIEKCFCRTATKMPDRIENRHCAGLIFSLHFRGKGGVGWKEEREK